MTDTIPPGGRKKAPQPGVAQPVSTTEKRDTRFKAGNPGRPKGALNKSTMAALAIMEADAETISRKAVELALGGDLTAIRIVLDRLVAPRRDRPVEIALPKIVAAVDLVAAAAAIADAVAEGEDNPQRGALIEHPRREYGQGDRNIRTVRTPRPPRRADGNEGEQPMNRLMQRLAYLESRLIPEGRGIAIFEDIHFEDAEARIDRCLAEVGRSPRDMIIILRDFSDPGRDRASPAAP